MLLTRYARSTAITKYMGVVSDYEIICEGKINNMYTILSQLLQPEQRETDASIIWELTGNELAIHLKQIISIKSWWLTA